MNKLAHRLLIASILVSGVTAFGQEKVKHVLQESQMDGLTAGSAIAVDAANITSNDSAAVNLSGSALSGASAVNIVNSSNSLVANGVNVYDSSLSTQDSTSGAAVNQMNTTKQAEGVNANVNVPTFSADNIGSDGSETTLTFTAAATATNIAAAGSSVSTTSNYSVELAGSAEQNASALNILNAAGGLVSNGINIAHSSNINAIPTLNQVNVISQSR